MSNQDQIDYWNGDAGQKWVNFSTQLDKMLSPFLSVVTQKADIQPHDHVLDIGCGAGALTLKAAETAETAIGVDVSEPLIGLARKRAESRQNVSFKVGDAQDISLDHRPTLALSRFGVMFFDDPVLAFNNIRKALHTNGRMVFVCWQSPMKNLWAKAPLEAALPFFKKPPAPPEPQAPGPFAFADKAYLEGVLTTAGWSSVTLNEWTGDITLPGDDAKQAAGFMMEMGPLSRILKDQELDVAPIKAALVESLTQAAADDGTIALPGAVWVVSATAN